MIDPNFWQSEDVSKLSLIARLLLIGMISNSDDEGRGRANPNYLKSTIFPYDNIKQSEIEKHLNEIKNYISILVYEVDGSSYYAFTSWQKWQRVDKPQVSLIPSPQNNSENNSKNDSRITLDQLSPNIKEENIREVKVKESNNVHARFLKPTLEEVQQYCQERNNKVNPQSFIDFYESKGWYVGKNPMKDWKAAVRTWENNGYKNTDKSSIKRNGSFFSDFVAMQNKNEVKL